MFKRIKLVAVTMTIIMLPVLYVSPAMALFSSGGSQSAACTGAQNNVTAFGCAPSGGGSVSSLVSTIVSILSYVVGVASIIMIIFGGFRMITSNGDSTAMANGRNTIIYALIGLAIAAMAQLLVHFVLAKTIKATTGSVLPSVVMIKL